MGLQGFCGESSDREKVPAGTLREPFLISVNIDQAGSSQIGELRIKACNQECVSEHPPDATEVLRSRLEVLCGLTADLIIYGFWHPHVLRRLKMICGHYLFSLYLIFLPMWNSWQHI